MYDTRRLKIKEFGIVYSGTTPDTKYESNFNGNINWFTPAEITEKNVAYVFDSERKITEEARSKKSIPLLPKNTVLLTSRAPIGKVAIAKKECCTNQGFKNIVCNEDIIIPKYLYYWLSSKKEYLNSLGRGATFKEISKKIVEEIEVPVPPLNIQEQLVSVLDKLSKVIQNRQSQIAALDELTQSIFLVMFGDPLINPNKLLKSKLRDLCLKITDGTHHSPPMVEEGVPYISAKHLGKGYLDFYSNPAYVSKEDHEKIYKRCDPIKGDVLYIKDGATTGIAGINHYDFEFSMLSSLALIRTDSEKLNNYYLVHYLNNERVKEKALNNMSGGAIKRLTIKKISEFPIMIPPIDLQNIFAAQIVEVDKQKEKMKSNLINLNHLYNSLIQKAFKGELFQELVDV
ncbi:restriction endonuclease subunit S [Niallia circulans]|uniref:restriction endonuclease subunit S n=1 Tax=Niallia circulans TaxID=1397 RepID=UPI0026EF534C|nr:restriction endonuclease subunit S [Niallia circulans]